MKSKTSKKSKPSLPPPIEDLPPQAIPLKHSFKSKSLVYNYFGVTMQNIFLHQIHKSQIRGLLKTKMATIVVEQYSGVMTFDPLNILFKHIRQNGNIRALNFRIIDVDEDYPESIPNFWLNTVRKNTYLKRLMGLKNELTLNHISFFRGLCKHKHLETLRVDHANDYKAFIYLLPVIKSCKNLKSLRVYIYDNDRSIDTYPSFDIFLSKANKLKRLDISSDFHENPKTLEKIFLKLPLLQKFRFAYPRLHEDETYSIKDKTFELTALSLTLFGRINLDLIANSMPKLKYLELDFCRDTAIEEFQKCYKYFTSVTSLSLLINAKNIPKYNFEFHSALPDLDRFDITLTFPKPMLLRGLFADVKKMKKLEKYLCGFRVAKKFSVNNMKDMLKLLPEHPNMRKFKVYIHDCSEVEDPDLTVLIQRAPEFIYLTNIQFRFETCPLITSATIIDIITFCSLLKNLEKLEIDINECPLVTTKIHSSYKKLALIENLKFLMIGMTGNAARMARGMNKKQINELLSLERVFSLPKLREFQIFEDYYPDTVRETLYQMSLQKKLRCFKINEIE